MNILMVCLGNICRSPLAEGIFRRHVEARGLDWTIDSAGTGSWHVGERPDTRSIHEAFSHGIDISDQRARQLKTKDLTSFDFIFAMDRSNLHHILDLASREGTSARAFLFLDYAGRADLKEVPDPYWDNNGFSAVFQMIDKASPAIIDRILESQHISNTSAFSQIVQ